MCVCGRAYVYTCDVVAMLFRCVCYAFLFLCICVCGPLEGVHWACSPCSFANTALCYTHTHAYTHTHTRTCTPRTKITNNTLLFDFIEEELFVHACTHTHAYTHTRYTRTHARTHARHTKDHTRPTHTRVSNKEELFVLQRTRTRTRTYKPF